MYEYTVYKPVRNDRPDIDDLIYGSAEPIPSER